MRNLKLYEARAKCALCGDEISSSTEFAEASCECGAIGVIGGPDAMYRGRPQDIILLHAKEDGSFLQCPHCGKEFPVPR